MRSPFSLRVSPTNSYQMVQCTSFTLSTQKAHPTVGPWNCLKVWRFQWTERNRDGCRFKALEFRHFRTQPRSIINSTYFTIPIWTGTWLFRTSSSWWVRAYGEPGRGFYPSHGCHVLGWLLFCRLSCQFIFSFLLEWLAFWQHASAIGHRTMRLTSRISKNIHETESLRETSSRVSHQRNNI